MGVIVGLALCSVFMLRFLSGYAVFQGRKEIEVTYLPTIGVVCEM